MNSTSTSRLPVYSNGLDSKSSSNLSQPFLGSNNVQSSSVLNPAASTIFMNNWLQANSMDFGNVNNPMNFMTMFPSSQPFNLPMSLALAAAATSSPSQPIAGPPAGAASGRANNCSDTVSVTTTKAIKPSTTTSDASFSHDYLHDTEAFLLIAGKSLTQHEKIILASATREVSTLPVSALNVVLMKQYKKRWFERSYLKDITQSTRGGVVKSAFYAMILRQYLIHHRRSLPPVSVLDDFSNILTEGALSLTFDRRETVYHLLGFVRAMYGLSEMGLSAVSNKHVYLHVGSMLEGSGLFYATGGAPSKSTQRRLAMIIQFTGMGKKVQTISMNGSDEDDGDDECPDYPQPRIPSLVSPERVQSQLSLPYDTNILAKRTKEEDILVESFYDRSQAPPSKYMKITNPETLLPTHEHFVATGSVVSSNTTSPVEEPIQTVRVEGTTELPTQIPVSQHKNIPNVFALLAAYAAFLPPLEE